METTESQWGQSSRLCCNARTGTYCALKAFQSGVKDFLLVNPSLFAHIGHFKGIKVIITAPHTATQRANQAIKILSPTAPKPVAISTKKPIKSSKLSQLARAHKRTENWANFGRAIVFN